jgi:hypothetical protein
MQSVPNSSQPRIPWYQAILQGISTVESIAQPRKASEILELNEKQSVSRREFKWGGSGKTFAGCRDSVMPEIRRCSQAHGARMYPNPPWKKGSKER